MVFARCSNSSLTRTLNIHPAANPAHEAGTVTQNLELESQPQRQTALNRLTPSQATGSHWKLVTLLMLVAALGHFNRVGMSVAGAERIVPQYDIEPAQMGLVYSAFLLCYTLAMLPAGWFIDRYGARSTLVVFGFASSIFAALTGCVGLVFHGAQGVWLGLIGVRALMGITNAPLHPAAARMIFTHVPHESKSLANGLVTFAAACGMAATYYALGTLIDRWDWPTAFLICSGVTMVAAVLWLVGTRSFAVPASTRGASFQAAPRVAEILHMLGRRSIVCLTLSYGALGFFQYLFFYWIEYYFETIQNQGVGVARQYSTCILLAMGVGMVGGGWLADRVATLCPPRFRRSLVPVLGMIGAGVIFELGLLSADIRITLLAFAAAAAFIGACEGAFWTTAVELGGPFGGTAAALMNTGCNIGGTLSPYVIPLLSAYFAHRFGEGMGWRMSLSVAGGISLLGAGFWWGVNQDQGNWPARKEA
jgi:MFS family permease